MCPNLNCVSIMMSFLAYITGFFMNFELFRFGLIWFSGFRGEDLNVIFYQNMPNLHNRYILAERKISQNPPFKMAAVTKNRNFFNCPLLLYYKSK
jgi:hypothetical protein